MGLNPSGLFITGTDTGVGKTFLGAALTRALRQRGVKVLVRKPVETGCTQAHDGLLPQDAYTLSRAAGDAEPLAIVCPYRFAAPVSPQRAAQLEGHPLTLENLIEACRSAHNGFMLVEGAGGFYSPIASDALNADLAQALGFPVLLVTADRLGVIHQVLTTLEAIARRGLTPAGVILNQLQKTEVMDNLQDLCRFSSVPVYPLPCLHAEEEADLGDLLAGLQSLGLALTHE